MSLGILVKYVPVTNFRGSGYRAKVKMYDGRTISAFCGSYSAPVGRPANLEVALLCAEKASLKLITENEISLDANTFVFEAGPKTEG